MIISPQLISNLLDPLLKLVFARLQIVTCDVTRRFQDEVVLFLRHFLYLVHSFLDKVNLFLKFFGNRLDLWCVLNVTELEAKDLLLGLINLAFCIRALLLL